MHHGDEVRFAEVLNQFPGYISDGNWPQRVSGERVARYTLLAKAYERSHRRHAIAYAGETLDLIEPPGR
jgi:hypothetical protein